VHFEYTFHASQNKTGENREKPHQKRAMSLHFQGNCGYGPQVGMRTGAQKVVIFQGLAALTEKEAPHAGANC